MALRYLVVVGVSFLISAGAAAARDAGGDRSSVKLSHETIEVFTYRPKGCLKLDLMLVFHGLRRDAENYRDGAVPLADRLCTVIVAPRFDAGRFPNWRYQRGGVMRHGSRLPRAQWTASIVAELMAWARTHERLPDARIYLFGHSAGGQFLSRVAAFADPLHVTRIVIANPSSHVAPALDEDAPYGFGGLFDGAEAEMALKRYLLRPITIYLGDADTGRRNLLTNAAAQRQGVNRLERGRGIYRMALAVARSRGWTCNWTIVEARGVGHSFRAMLRAPEVWSAFRRQPVRAAEP